MRHLRSVRPRSKPPAGACNQDSSIVAPTLTGGDLYAVADGWVTKWDAATRHLLWTVNPDPTFSYGFSFLAVTHGLVVVGGDFCFSTTSPLGRIEAFRVSNGSLAWSVSSPDSDALTQMVVSGRFVIAAGGDYSTGTEVSVRRVRTGALVWDHLGNCSVDDTLLVVDQRVIYSGCDASGAPALTADALATGAKSWSRPGSWQPQRGDAASLAGRHLYVLSPGGHLADLSPSSGKTRFRLAGATSVLAVDARRAYATCAGPAICGYRKTTGKRVWATADGSSSAAEAGGVLYLSDGLALNARTGARVAALRAHLAARALVVGDGQIAVVTRPQVLGLYGLPGS
ncbi:MAG: PQQ-binding-like beta-propeller repeat protein [Streptosporangiaceae bacterium]